MANVGEVTEFQASVVVNGIAGVNDLDVVIQFDQASRYRNFTIQSVAGALEVFVSLDGTTFSPVIFLRDFHTATDTVLVNTTIATEVYSFAGNFKSIRVGQQGATAATGAVLIGSR